MESGETAPRILKLDTRLNCRHWPSYPGGNVPRYPVHWSVCGSQSQPGDCGKRHMSCILVS